MHFKQMKKKIKGGNSLHDSGMFRTLKKITKQKYYFIYFSTIFTFS